LPIVVLANIFKSSSAAESPDAKVLSMSAAVVEQQTLSHPIEEQRPQRLLELVDGGAGRGLRKGHIPGRRTGAPMQRDRLENLQLPQREFHGVRKST
jgi:hypothetical protein